MPVDLTDDTTAIRARSKGVTAWRTEMTADRHWNVIYAKNDLDNDWRIALVSDDDDAEFIAHAPTDVAFLLARVEQLERQHERDTVIGDLTQAEFRSHSHTKADLEMANAQIKRLEARLASTGQETE